MTDTEKIGGILCYSTTGHMRACGQTIGANGRGEFAIILLGTPEQADVKAREIIGGMKADGYRFSSVVFVPNDELASYSGNPLKIEDASK